MKDQDISEYIKILSNKYPFLTFFNYAENDYIGIIQGYEEKFLSFYVYNYINDDKLKKLFLKFGEIWWWESSRNYPINLFLKGKFDIFNQYLKIFNKKGVNFICGPTFLDIKIFGKPSKRKQIIFLKR
ncbi:MAG: hypothetical protein NZZ41_00425 [Candidatus Dojkabacteria bacterium]|nr:hypothetical protein [Candidatus Dojkabacteria bacterium]